MAYRTLLAALGVTGLLLPGMAQAADMPSLPQVGPHAQVTEYFSAWYLRGDVGYRFNNISDGLYPGGPITGSSLRDSGSITGGVGYRYGWMRYDVTVDYGSRPQFDGNTTISGPVSARLTNWTALLNGYVDLGNWYGFTPYLGAGIGYSFLKPADFFNASLLYPTMTTDSRWAPSWALMGGISYLFSPVWLLDISYRYLDIGESRSDIQAGGTIQYGNWTAQEIRIGLRYLIP